MDDYKQTKAIISNFFRMKDKTLLCKNEDKTTEYLRDIFNLLNNSDSFGQFKDFYLLNFWQNKRNDIKKTLDKIKGYQIINDTGAIIAKTTDGSFCETIMLTPEEFVATYLKDIPEKYEDFAKIYFYDLSNNIMAQILHLGYTHDLYI